VGGNGAIRVLLEVRELLAEVDHGANQTMCQGEPSRAGADHKDAW
jgi:hypothetical protein